MCMMTTMSSKSCVNEKGPLGPFVIILKSFDVVFSAFAFLEFEDDKRFGPDVGDAMRLLKADMDHLALANFSRDAVELEHTDPRNDDPKLFAFKMSLQTEAVRRFNLN